MTRKEVEMMHYYNGARYYNPTWSVWLGVDPLAHEFSSWTPYHFVHNNPINLIDPTGMNAIGPGDPNNEFGDDHYVGPPVEVVVPAPLGPVEGPHMKLPFIGPSEAPPNNSYRTRVLIGGLDASASAVVSLGGAIYGLSVPDDCQCWEAGKSGTLMTAGLGMSSSIGADISVGLGMLNVKSDNPSITRLIRGGMQNSYTIGYAQLIGGKYTRFQGDEVTGNMLSFTFGSVGIFDVSGTGNVGDWSITEVQFKGIDSTQVAEKYKGVPAFDEFRERRARRNAGL